MILESREKKYAAGVLVSVTHQSCESRQSLHGLESSRMPRMLRAAGSAIGLGIIRQFPYFGVRHAAGDGVPLAWLPVIPQL